MRIFRFYLLSLLTVCLNINVVSAQDTTAKWHFLVEPYLMIPGMKGEATIRRIPPAEINADAEDIFSSLDFGAIALYRGG